MSDFLTTLAGRTLGAIPVIAPRQPARFEPSTYAGAPILRERHTETVAPPPDRTSGFPGHGGMVAPSAARAPSAETRREQLPRPSPPALPPTSATPIDRPLANQRPDDLPLPPRPSVVQPMPTADSASVRPAARPVSVQPRPQLRRTSTPAQPGAASSAPTVHITIGRIEVRAVQRPEKPAAAPPSPTQPARVSLTDYLRRHSGSRE